MRKAWKTGKTVRARSRRGASAVDYVLVMGTVLPLGAVLYSIAPKIMNLVYDMICVLVVMPFP